MGGAMGTRPENGRCGLTSVILNAQSFRVPMDY
jgi:hypothetical protein